MTILLRAPEYRPGGPDGKGWNRLSLCAHMGTPANQCALQPRTWGTLREIRELGSSRARFGNYGRCTNRGDCGTCPILAAKPETLGAFTDKILVRFLERRTVDGYTRTELHLMNKPEDGWSSRSYVWTWEELVRLVGWDVGRRYADEHSEGFWLHKVDPNTHDGRPSPCDHEYLNPDHCPTCRI